MFDERESHEFELAADLAAIERRLAGLAPPPLQMDRDRLMFAAGRAASLAARRQPSKEPALSLSPRWFWPAATATMTAATVLLSAMLVWQHEPQTVAQEDAKPQAAIEHVADVDVPDPARSTDHVASWTWTSRATRGYLGLRNTALARGVGAIEFHTLSVNGRSDPVNAAPRPEPATARELLHELLPGAGWPRETRS